MILENELDSKYFDAIKAVKKYQKIHTTDESSLDNFKFKEIYKKSKAFK